MEEVPKLSNPEILFPKITEDLLAMCKVDQDMRERSIQDRKWWDGSVDKRNTERMKEIVDEIGWPTETKVGQKASIAAWLLVQHADHDVEFQERCLALMRAASEGVRPQDIAMLTDRVRVNRGQPQVYGTQYNQVAGRHEPREIEDAANVDNRRATMGLDSLRENIDRMYEKYPLPDKG